MAKFRYRFEDIKLIKERLEKKVQKELNEIEMRLEQKMTEIKDVLYEKESLKYSITGSKFMKALEAQQKLYQEQYLDEKRSLLESELKVIQQEKEAKREELLKRTMERKTFEALREKHFAVYQAEEKLIEARQIDEIATINYMRNKQ